jgi:hypothetical protein
MRNLPAADGTQTGAVNDDFTPTHHLLRVRILDRAERLSPRTAQMKRQMTTNEDTSWMPPTGVQLEWAEQQAKETPSSGSERRPCSRFPAARIEELLLASNDLSEGEEIKYEDARDLALYALDEMERVRNAYQARFGDLMLKAMDLTNSFAEAMPFPENETSPCAGATEKRS